MRVLVLRPHEAGARTAAALAAHGHEAIVAPVLEPAPTGAPAPQGAFDALIATSAQAFVHAPAASLAGLRALPLHVVGERTADAARVAGFARIGFIEPDAARLSARLCAQLADAAARSTSALPCPRLLYLAGAQRKSALEDSLAAAGAQVVAWDIYDARASRSLPEAARTALAAGRADAALHFSRRSAHAFCDLAARAGLIPQAARLRHVAISADAAAGLAELAPRDLRIAASPDETGVLAALA